MKSISLCGEKGKGVVMLVDNADYDRVSAKKWYYSNGYAVTVEHVSGNRKNRNQNYIAAHRYVLGLVKGKGIVDHINRNRLDNRRGNLRVTDYRGNARNCVTKKKQGYKGVRRESENCFSAKLLNQNIGYYRTAKLAALAYDSVARNTYQDFACLNFPDIHDYSGIVCLPSRNLGKRTSSIVGISYSTTRKAVKKWRAVWCKKHLGWFSTEADAAATLRRAKSESKVSTARRFIRTRTSV